MPHFYNVGHADIGRPERAAVRDVMRSGQLTHAHNVQQFEEAFGDRVGKRFALACNSGTAALHLALLASGIGSGDEVIVPSLTYVATVNAIRYVGATPVFADVDPETWCITEATVIPLITQKTKAIMPVGLYGAVPEMDNSMFIIEDGAENLGTIPVGHIATYSFYGNKTITTGEGGMLVTDDASFYDLAYRYRGQGNTSEAYWHNLVGYNYRMTEIAAAIGLVQLSRLDTFLEERRRVFKRYYEQCPGITFQAQDIERSGVWGVCILIEPRHDRKYVQAALEEKGIETRPVFRPVHTMPMYATQQLLPQTGHISRYGIMLPTYPGLTNDDIDYIAKTVNEVLAL